MTSETRPGQRARREIIDAALTLFSRDGFGSTSIQDIADASGYSKSSVLYHFDSKERMLEAAISPSLDALEGLVDAVPVGLTRPGETQTLVARFVDFLLEHRREAAIELIQGRSLAAIPVMDRANRVVSRLSERIAEAAPTVAMQLRVGVGLAGAAYVLIAGDKYSAESALQPDDEVRAALIEVLSDLFTLEK